MSDADGGLRFLPVGLDVRGRHCVVVGGGAVGTRKVATLLRAGARVVVVSPEITEALEEAVATPALEWVRGPFQPEHLRGAFLVVAATDDEAVNVAVVEGAIQAGALACDASSVERSQVIFGAMLTRHDATLAVFTDGRDPARARRIRDSLADLMP